MARTPNYAQQRFERNRAKQAKREEKLRQQQELTAQRKAATQPDSDAEKEPSSD
jgi:hypothetical protein